MIVNIVLKSNRGVIKSTKPGISKYIDLASKLQI